ncbi:sodium- and chloride-dependent glycine transporter 1 [Octopus sinensis]|uniref:Transporter n=1 Tax=Octopus sinensis TaxID=2607531 RepID=A0A6P7TVC7_9MOLL|nr:sodium- and chloride-dependent glycine transporter 1 [Octopus sinensis]
MTKVYEEQVVKTIDEESNSSTSDDSSSISSDENKDRGNWTGRLDFMLSCVGFAVGLGNIWRFPYLCYKSGGGAFLVPYFLFLFLCGIPLVFMETSYGQFASLSPLTAWRISPMFKGVGYGMVIVSGIVCIYYNIILAWTLYYLFHSFREVLPWSNCENKWNSKNCVVTERQNVTETLNSTVFTTNGTMLANATSLVGLSNATDLVDKITNDDILSNVTKVSPSEEFWQLKVLEITDGIEDLGIIRWELLLCLLLAWVVVFLCLCKGIKSSGRVVYVTATFPYLVLTILLIRGVTLPGAWEGLKFYLIPKWSRLLDFQVWGDAATQIFYSVGMSWGGLITMASYNKFHNNVYRDAMLIPVIGCTTSVYAGLVIFSVLGFMSYETGIPIEDVVTQGPGLTFVAYPEAVTKLPVSPLWAILFFLMLFTVGLDSQFGMFETMTSAFIDEFPELLAKRKVLFTAAICFVEFLCGIPFVTQGGIYLLQVVDWYCSTFSLMILSLTECVVISWIYGADRFYNDITLMIGYKPCVWWKISWRFITPTITLLVWLFSISKLSPVTYGDYTYPTWSVVLGWILGMVSLVPLPAVMISQIFKTKGTFIERVKKLIHPDPKWGPSLPQYREQYIASLSFSERQRMLRHIMENEKDGPHNMSVIGEHAKMLQLQLDSVC